MESIRPILSVIHRRVRALTFATLVLGSITILNAVYATADGRRLDALALLLAGIAALGLTRVLYLYWGALEIFLASPDGDLPALVAAQARFWRYLLTYVTLVVMSSITGALAYAYYMIGAMLHLPNLPVL